jgi:hypothetical protein
MVLEIRPGLVGDGLSVPFSNVAGKDGRPGDDDDADVDELFGCFGSLGYVGHGGVVVDIGEKIYNRAGVIVSRSFDFCLGDGEGLR